MDKADDKEQKFKLKDLKKEPEDPENKHKGKFQVYDLRDSDLDQIDLSEFNNSIIFFSNGDFVDEQKEFERALDRLDGLLNREPKKYFNFFVITNNQCSPQLKEMVVRKENSLEQLNIPCPLILDVHGKLGTQYQASTFIVGIGIDGRKLFEFEVKNDKNIESNMMICAMMIKDCLDHWVEISRIVCSC